MNSTKINSKNIKISEDLAEFYGAMIGDGCLSKYYSKDRKTAREVALLTGHMINDIDYYNNTIRPILIKEFGTKGRLQKRTKYNAILYWITKQSVFKFFENIGFPVGKKLKLEIPPQILVNNKKAIACVRGIFNTDGTIYRRYSKQYQNHAKFYKYLVIQFKLNSCQVITQIKDILERNDLKTTKIGRDKKCYVLRITNQKDISKFMKIFRPTNCYHTERYLNLR